MGLRRERRRDEVLADGLEQQQRAADARQAAAHAEASRYAAVIG